MKQDSRTSNDTILAARISRLTQQQRAFLADRLPDHDAVEEAPNGGQLTAWYVATDPSLTTERMRAMAAERLPANLIPRHFVPVSTLPRTTTGKVDRRLLALPTPAPSDFSATSNALSDMEATLLAVWQEVLETDHISRHDNFFQAGGDSMGIIRVIALCAEAGLHLTPGVLYDHPTIAQLARHLSLPTETTDRETDGTSSKRVTVTESAAAAPPAAVDASAQPSSAAAVPLRLSEYSDKPPLFLIPPQGVAVGTLRHVVAAVSQYTCFAPVTTERDAVNCRTTEEVARQFVAQMMSLQPQGPYRIAGTCEGAYIAWDITRLLNKADTEVSFLGIIDTPNPVSMKPLPLAERIRFRLRTLQSSSAREAVAQIVQRAASHVRRRFRQTLTKEVHLTRTGSRMGWLFQAQPYAGHATLFKAIHPSANTEFTTDPAHGWGHLPQAGLDICSIACDRLQMLDPPFAAVLAERLELAIKMREVEPVNAGKHKTSPPEKSGRSPSAEKGYLD